LVTLPLLAGWDILCAVGGHEVYFELGRLLDEGMQRLRLQMLKQAPVPVNPGLYDLAFLSVRC